MLRVLVLGVLESELLVSRVFLSGMLISVDFVCGPYCIRDTYVKNTGTESLYIWGTCLCNACIGNASGVSAVKHLEK